jgi:glutamyl-tRNA reductase
MAFQLIGVNHKTAPVEMRERFVIPQSHLPNAVQRLVKHPGVGEGLILSTCNRMEMLVRTDNGDLDLRGFVSD